MDANSTAGKLVRALAGEPTPASVVRAARAGTHIAHCCIRHGCKYGRPDCPVKSGEFEQEYDCEHCDEDAEAQPVTLAELRSLMADFAAEVSIDLEAERLDWGPGTERSFERLAEKLGIRR
jgi:hypothetical protein